MSKLTFLVCVKNDGYEASLELRKLYRVLPDAQAARLGQVRVVEESGEDYLLPNSLFAPVRLPSETKELLLAEA